MVFTWIHMVFAFNPFPRESLHMDPPKSNHFYCVQTKYRYRSSIKIQKCTAFLGHDLVGSIYNERYATDSEGEKPTWINICNATAVDRNKQKS